MSLTIAKWKTLQRFPVRIQLWNICWLRQEIFLLYRTKSRTIYVKFTLGENWTFFLVLNVTKQNLSSSEWYAYRFLCRSIDVASISFEDDLISNPRSIKKWRNNGFRQGEDHSISEELELVASLSDFSSSNVALNPNSFPGVNNDLSSSAAGVVVIFLSFTFRFSWLWMKKIVKHIHLNFPCKCKISKLLSSSTFQPPPIQTLTPFSLKIYSYNIKHYCHKLYQNCQS